MTDRAEVTIRIPLEALPEGRQLTFTITAERKAEPEFPPNSPAAESDEASA